LPLIIQGGMGAAVSGWPLARAVARAGHLGVVSGTALATVLVRRLQLGDPSGRIRHALEQFPVAGVGERILAQYFIEGGKSPSEPFATTAMPVFNPGGALVELTVAASFVEVFLSKEGHCGLVGINLLEKIQLPTLPSLFGAMLADVDYVLMGAGIPRSIPNALDCLARGEAVTLKIDVAGAVAGEEAHTSFDPARFCGGVAPILKRPMFLGIVGSATLAITLAKKSSGRVDGFVVEGETAGGHISPPRGPLQLGETGEPIYGPRDSADLTKIRAIGLPFWLAGSYGRPGRLADAQSLGAVGIQVGTAFAFCEESGISPEIKRKVIEQSRAGEVRVFTDPLASPTGFPFKVVQLEGTLSEQAAYENRERVCDLGYLRQAYRKPDGAIGYRCPGEPEADYLRKGGDIETTIGRKCVCNGLLAAVGLDQVHADGGRELPLVTAGNDVAEIAQFVPTGGDGYTAVDVIRRLLESEGAIIAQGPI
jgi:nitronate monooxygenase